MDSPESSLKEDQKETSSSRKMCIACKQEFPGTETTCPNDGTTLTRLTMEPAIGTTVGDKYEIVSVIGGGAMGLVYKAKHTLMKRTVALKMLHPNMTVDESTVKRFQKEAEALSCLNHPNILTVFDFGVSKDGHPYLITDYLEGQTLGEILEQNERLDWQRCIHIFKQVCSALAHAHRHGVVHRDIKPSNIMLTQFEDQQDFVKILDFGIAKVLDSEQSDGPQLTRTGEVFGSPLYMSPEQCRGKTLDARSDMYSLGCVIYRCLAGQPALFGQDLVECLYKHVHEEPLPMKEVAPDAEIPEILEQIVFKCLAKDPAARHQSMEDLRDELAMLIETAPSSSTIPEFRKTTNVETNHIKEQELELTSEDTSIVQKADADSSEASKSANENAAQQISAVSESDAADEKTSLENLPPIETSKPNNRDSNPDKLLDLMTSKRAVVATVVLTVMLVAVPVLMKFNDNSSDSHNTTGIANTKHSDKKSAYEKHMLAGLEEFESGYHNEAIENFRQALEEAKKNSDSTAEIAEALHNLIAVNCEASRYEEARSYLSELEELVGVGEGADIPETKLAAELFYDRASLLMYERSKDSRKRAQQLLIAALTFYESHKNKEYDLERMRTFAKLGQLALMNGDIKTASQFESRAMEVAKESSSISRLELALRMDQLGDTYLLLPNSEKHYVDAEALYKKALELRSSTLKDPNHPAMAQSYKRLGVMYFLRDLYPEALEQLNKSLAIRRKTARDLPIAEIERALSYVYLKMGDFDKAQSLFDEATKRAKSSASADQLKRWENGYNAMKSEARQKMKKIK